MYMSLLLLGLLSFELGLVSGPGEDGVTAEEDGELYGSMIGSGVLGPSFISTLELLLGGGGGGALEIEDRDSWICCWRKFSLTRE
jgi:hypothetical protein